MFTSYRSKHELIRTQITRFPCPQNSNPVRHRPSIITEPQATKIIKLLQSTDDKLRTLSEFIEWNEMTCEEQFMHTAKGYRDDLIEISLGSNGCSIMVTLFPLQEHQISLTMDPDTDIVIQEVAL